MHNFFLSFSLASFFPSNFFLLSFFMTCKGSWRKRLSWRRDRKMSRSLSFILFLSLSLFMSLLFLAPLTRSSRYEVFDSLEYQERRLKEREREREACSNSGGMNMNMSCSLSLSVSFDHMLQGEERERKRDRKWSLREGERGSIHPSCLVARKREREREGQERSFGDCEEVNHISPFLPSLVTPLLKMSLYSFFLPLSDFSVVDFLPFANLACH